MAEENETRNILVTGIPRSGSTLLIKTIAEHSDQVLVFDEPSWLKQIRQQADPAEVSTELLKQIDATRHQVGAGNPIELTFGPGNQKLTDNHFERTIQGIIRTKSTQEICLPKSYSQLNWLVKSNVFFTAVLSQLMHSGDFRLIATVRNPVAVLKSWRSLDISLSQGRSMIAERFDHELAGLESTKQLLKRQVILIDWMFKKYHMCQAVKVIKYESFIKDPAQLNGLIPSCQVDPGLRFESHNQSPHYNHAETELIINCLQQHGQYYKHYYPDLTASTKPEQE